MALLLIIAPLLIVLLAIYAIKKPPKFPPGPPRVPIFGSLPFLLFSGTGVEKFVSKKVESYGPVTGMYLGSYRTIMINDWTLAKSLFLQESFCARMR